MPGNLKGAELERFIRDAALTYWHQTCTAKMGQDVMSVVDSSLKVYGIEHLRIADGATMPRVTAGNTMARTVRRSWPTDQPVAISRHLIRTAPR